MSMLRDQMPQVTLLLVMMYFQYLGSGAQTTSSQFTKILVNGGGSECSTDNGNYQSFSLSVSANSKISCSALCNADDNCLLFDIEGNSCQLYAMRLPSTSSCGTGTAGTVAYTRLVRDLALLQPVSYSSTVDDHISPFSDLTSGKTTFPNFLYCPCTLFGSDNWITVDLGRTYNVKRVDIMASFEGREGYFLTTNIHVGNQGSSSDLIVGGKDATIPGEREVLKFDVSANGRYLTLVQQDATHFCLCKIQVYGY